MGLALCAFLALSKPGDVSIRDECRKGTLTTLVDPQPEGSADSLSGLDYGALCNEDARRRMTLVAVMGVGTRSLPSVTSTPPGGPRDQDEAALG
jgi:hypothetical protein